MPYIEDIEQRWERQIFRDHVFVHDEDLSVLFVNTR